MNGLICQKCNSTKQIPLYENDNFFVCEDCGNIIGYDCPKCEHFYTNNHLAYYNNAYVCKSCGEIQWGYTAWKTKKGRDV